MIYFTITCNFCNCEDAYIDIYYMNEEIYFHCVQCGLKEKFGDEYCV